MVSWPRPHRMLLVVCSLGLFANLANGSGFKVKATISVGAAPIDLALSDFNHDGKLDIAEASYDSDNTVSVLLGNGDGTFRQLVYRVGSGPYAVAAADVNLDGNSDLVVTNLNDDSISVLLGNGDGSFQSALTFLVGDYPLGVALGDLNGDGIPDAVTASYGPGVLLGNGDGTFQSPLFPTTTYSYSVAIGDLNGDGKPDLALGQTVGIFNEGIVQILLGNGDGTFEVGSSYSLMVSTPYSIAVADLNHDGKLDIAASTFGLAVAVLLGRGDATFNSPVYYTTPFAAYGVAIADFNRDGHPDLAVSNFAFPSDLSTFAGNGDGTFQMAVNYKLPAGSNYAEGIVAGDFNGDGSPDVVLANDTSANLSVLLNTGGTLMRTTSSVNPSKVGQKVTFTTQVKQSIPGTGVPTGTVKFKDGTTLLGTANLVNGKASLTTSSLTQGTHRILGSYSGDANFNPNSAKPLVQVVDP